MKEPHFQMHKFGKGLKPLPEQLNRFLIIHQVYWTSDPCSCRPIEDAEDYGGVWSFVSPVKHSPDMISYSMACRFCSSLIPVTARVEYVDVDATTLADMPVPTETIQ